MTPSSSQPPLIRFAGIGKRFPGVVALLEFAFDIAPGEINEVISENVASN